MRSFSPSTIKIALVALLAGTLVIALLVGKKPTYSTAPLQNTDAQQNTAEAPIKVAEPVAAIEVAAVQSTHPKANTPANNKMVSNKISWQLGNSKSATPPIPLNQVISEYEVVEVEQQPESLPQVGETVELPMLKGKKILVNVESMQSNPNGDKTWTGHMEGFGTDYPVIMTYGTNTVFATITTPEGSYTLESKDGSGWLYKNPSEFELSDAGSKDYLEIPDAHKL